MDTVPVFTPSTFRHTPLLNPFLPRMRSTLWAAVKPCAIGMHALTWPIKNAGEKNVTLVGGVAPTALQFGRYLSRKYHTYPKKLWQVIVLTLGSVPGINTRLAESLRALYGNAAIREIYGATEGMFGQQLDEQRAWSPNYDLFFFEVQTPSGIKQLHQMHPGEIGKLVVSTPVLPRYMIGDLILAFRPPYFRCIGRDHWLTTLKYAWYEFSTFNFGRL